MRRRDFLKNGAVALTAAATKPLFAWQGANNRVRMAVIGMGGRSGRVFDSLTRYDDVQFTMGCEVSQSKQQSFQSANRPLAQTLNVVGDYRRVLDRNDIDAVLIGTPDFSHARITADALAAGKHVYVEKPISNNIARINMMLDAYNKYPNLVVQVGTQQRSWDHFIEAKKQMERSAPSPTCSSSTAAAIRRTGRRSRRCRPGSTGTGGRWTRRRSRSSPGTRRSARGGSTAAASSATGAPTTSTSRTGS